MPNINCSNIFAHASPIKVSEAESSIVSIVWQVAFGLDSARCLISCRLASIDIFDLAETVSSAIGYADTVSPCYQSMPP